MEKFEVNWNRIFRKGPLGYVSGDSFDFTRNFNFTAAYDETHPVNTEFRIVRMTYASKRNIINKLSHNLN